MLAKWGWSQLFITIYKYRYPVSTCGSWLPKLRYWSQTDIFFQLRMQTLTTKSSRAFPQNHFSNSKPYRRMNGFDESLLLHVPGNILLRATFGFPIFKTIWVAWHLFSGAILAFMFLNVCIMPRYYLIGKLKLGRNHQIRGHILVLSGT